MNNLDAILEVAIGLILTWLILSVATMQVQDIISDWLNRRARFLEKSILEMFQGEQDLVDLFYEQPVIKAFYKKNRKGKPRKNILGRLKKPDYIPNEAFAEALFEMFVNLGTEEGVLQEDTISLERIIQKTEEMAEKNKDLGYFIRRLLPDFDEKKSIAKLRKTHNQVAEFKTNAENWFDASMTKASFWYKEHAKTLAFFIGLGLAITFNVDSIRITEQLWREPTLRQSLIAQAQVADENTGAKSVEELETYYQDLHLPVGWGTENMPANWFDWAWAVKALGFAITALAAMQGAPFWFDILKNLLKLKGGSKKTEAPPPAASAPPPAPPPASSEIEAVG
ncbi:MAG: hypothetical protein GY755_18145 [Chloroflexi bacterium]|nr:hypothetical protein [Chloroflexota bacterium]